MDWWKANVILVSRSKGQSMDCTRARGYDVERYSGGMGPAATWHHLPQPTASTHMPGFGSQAEPQTQSSAAAAAPEAGSRARLVRQHQLPRQQLAPQGAARQQRWLRCGAERPAQAAAAAAALVAPTAPAAVLAATTAPPALLSAVRSLLPPAAALAWSAGAPEPAPTQPPWQPLRLRWENQGTEGPAAASARVAARWAAAAAAAGAPAAAALAAPASAPAGVPLQPGAAAAAVLAPRLQPLPQPPARWATQAPHPGTAAAAGKVMAGVAVTTASEPAVAAAAVAVAAGAAGGEATDSPARLAGPRATASAGGGDRSWRNTVCRREEWIVWGEQRLGACFVGHALTHSQSSDETKQRGAPARIAQRQPIVPVLAPEGRVGGAAVGALLLCGVAWRGVARHARPSSSSSSIGRSC